MDSFESKFWRQVKKGGSVSDVMHKIGTAEQHQVVRFLEVISDPAFEKKYKKETKWVSAQLNREIQSKNVRSLKQLHGLARRLQTIARDLEQTFGPQGSSCHREELLKLSADCRLRAKEMTYLDWAYKMEPLRRPKAPTYRSFWKHLSFASLCLGLESFSIEPVHVRSEERL